MKASELIDIRHEILQRFDYVEAHHCFEYAIHSQQADLGANE